MSSVRLNQALPQIGMVESDLTEENTQMYVWTFMSREKHTPRKKTSHVDKVQRKIFSCNDASAQTLPKTFMDIFRDPIKLEWFRKFLISRGDGSEYMLLYILAVNELKQYTLSPDRVVNIYRYIKTYLLGANSEVFTRQRHPLWFRIRRTHNPSISLLIEGQCLLAKVLQEDYFSLYIGYTKKGDKVEYSSGSECDTRARRLIRWNKFIYAVIDFRKGLLDQNSHTSFKSYLLKESKVCYNNPMRMIGDKVFSTNKLIKDIEFWSEVERYKCMYDDNCNSDTLYRKARTIVDCFLDSSVLPRIQINITPDLANTVIQDLDTNGATRGLFHEAELAVFVTLMIFWRRYVIWRIDFDMKKLPHLPLLPKQTVLQPPATKKHEKDSLTVSVNPTLNVPMSKHRRKRPLTILVPVSSDLLPHITYSLASRRCCLMSSGQEIRTYRVHTKSLPTRLPSLYKIK